MGKCLKHTDRESGFLCMKHHMFMCEECLCCPNEDIYCERRSSCLIWYVEETAEIDIKNREAVEKIKHHTVVFHPNKKEITLSRGSTLLKAAQKADVRLNASCNGKGSCGKCKLIIDAGIPKSQPTLLLSETEKEKKYVLACTTTIQSDMVVKIPEETQARKLKVVGMGRQVSRQLKGIIKEINPMLVKIPLQLNPPTQENPVSDLDRLNLGLKSTGNSTDNVKVGLQVMRQISDAMRHDNWHVTVSMVQCGSQNEIVQVAPGIEEAKTLGLAVDIGTTSIVLYLVDMNDGSIIAAASGHNLQAACGDDVINRIVYAEKNGVVKLRDMGLETINSLIDDVLESAESHPHLIENVVLSGNTTMVHLLMGIKPHHIRREPYIPAVSAFPILKGKEIGLNVNPVAAVFIMPSPASYVGGDIVSGLIYSGLHREDPLTLFIDVGTNGEIVLGNREWLMTASCSAGPSFEGGGVLWGMRAEQGAIEKISIDPATLKPSIHTVGNAPPRGICGSGMIDLISEMLITGIIDPSGKFDVFTSHPRIKQNEYGPAYILAFAKETEMDEDILFTLSDIDNIIRSKGAIYAGFSVLLNQAGIDFSMVDQMIITGGFGQYLDIEKAVTIGLLPDIDRSKFNYMGNSSIAGAYMALLSNQFREEARQVSDHMTYIDFSSNNQFMDEFTSALFLPHTNLDAFPSVKSKI